MRLDAAEADAAIEMVMRVFIVGAVRLFREGTARLLAEERLFQVVGVGAECDETIGGIRATNPDVVVMDPHVARRAENIHRLAEMSPTSWLVVVGIGDSESEVAECAHVGVSGLFGRDISAADLAIGLRAVGTGAFPCPPTARARLLGRAVGGNPRPRDVLRPLTSRERDVAKLIDRGLTNKEIAVRLSLEVATVKNHVHHILDKLGARTRAIAIAKLAIMDIDKSRGRSLPPQSPQPDAQNLAAAAGPHDP